MTNYLTLTRWASAILFVASLACIAGLARQPGQRVVSQYPLEPGTQSPLEVVSVRVKGEEVEPGRPFAAGDDWLAGLALWVKNVSGKPISFVDVRLHFPAPAGDNRKSLGIVGMLRFGCWQGGGGVAPYAVGSCKEIMPGQTQGIELTDETYKRLGRALAQFNLRTPVESVQFEIDGVVFDPDTRWSRGLLFKRDPVEANKFRTVGRYLLPDKPE